MEVEWSGVFPYVPSPLRPDGTVDLGTLEGITDRCIRAGVHGLTPLGSSGELPLLRAEQRRSVIEHTVRVAAGRVPVVSGACGFDTATLVTAARDAVLAGSDGVLLVPLAYFPLTDRELFSMIGAVVDAVDAPVVLYNHPHLTHVTFSPSLAGRACRELGVRYLKDASGMITNVPRWGEASDGGLRVFSATAYPPTAAMLLGACGWMSGPASVFPAASVRIYEHAAHGRWEQARREEARLEPALEVFRRLGPARAVKTLLRAVGIDAGEPVAPIEPVDPVQVHELAERIGGLEETS